MRTGLAYTSARILMLIVSGIVLYLCGARGILLLVLAFVVSAIASYILLSSQREQMAGALNRRLSKATGRLTGKVTGKAAELRERLEEGTAAEDDANDAARSENAESPNQAVR